MKPIPLALLLVCVAAAAFAAGTIFGVRQGEQIMFLNTGMLDAEMARHKLAAIDQDDMADVKGLLAVELAGGLNRQYELLHYPYPLLMPASAKAVHRHDQEFASRISAYLGDHPEVLKPSADIQHLAQLPDATDEQTAFKESSIANSQAFDERVAWVLDFYRKSPPVH